VTPQDQDLGDDRSAVVTGITDLQARDRARRRVTVGGQALADIEGDARVVRLSDPPGVAVEAWVYLTEGDR